MNALAELIGISAEELVDIIIKDEKSLKKYYVMIESLQAMVQLENATCCFHGLAHHPDRQHGI